MPRILTVTFAGLLALLLHLPAPGWAQDKKPGDPKPPDKEVEKKLDPKDLKGKGGKVPRPTGLRKYEDVITTEAKTSKGIFTVHRIEDKIYFEIPEAAYGKYFLWMAEVAKASSGAGWGGKALGNRVVRWARRGNKVLLWQASFEKRSDGRAIERAVESADLASLLMSFNIETEGKDKSAVIAVNSLFTSDAGLVNGPSGIGESFVEELRAFPTNIETRLMLNFRGGAGGGVPMGPPGPGRFGGGGKASTMVVHYSMTLLPDQPMRGRYFDSRVGYFTRSFEDYSGTKDWMQRKEYIARFRLEKKDPKAALSEPIKPIVFYLSREVPEKWRPYLMKGVEDWKPAFEKAGFKNAIICKQAPTVKEDPTWDPEDARYSVIRWVADPTMNAMGPHVHDPRSGEIISAHVIFWHNITKLAQQWYFVQCGGSDPRAHKLPLPDD
ncbi:MAG TPA: DUF5117 domain-containing protein, partial [Gemmataceae bacterium]|nr:DUF5117 domain-containing protein [Gemmataceae bacterium]